MTAFEGLKPADCCSIQLVSQEKFPKVGRWVLLQLQGCEGGVVATLLVAGAVQKADVNEKFALEAQKNHRLKMAAEAEATDKAAVGKPLTETKLLMKQLADFDVAKYLVASAQEQREWYCLGTGRTRMSVAMCHSSR